MVLILPPPPNRPVSPLKVVHSGERRLIRIFDPTRHNAQALTFRHFDPLSRFDHHRGDPTSPSIDEERGINYWGLSLCGCLVEVFGDTKIVEIPHQEVAIVDRFPSLELLDLRGSGSMKAGSVVKYPIANCQGNGRVISTRLSTITESLTALSTATLTTMRMRSRSVSFGESLSMKEPSQNSKAPESERFLLLQKLCATKFPTVLLPII
jgi:hypothetical protein